MPKTSHETQPQSLSPEQIQRMQAKKDAALQRLAAKNTTGIPEGINSSWAKALSNEFSKPYFLKVS